MVLVSSDAPAGLGAQTCGLCARVSWHDQRDDLDWRVARLTRWAADVGGQVVRVGSEVGSGMDGSRMRVRCLLADPRVAAVVVEHRDRLGWMSTELVESALSARGRRLVVLDDGEVGDDLVGDLVEVLTLVLRLLVRPRVGAESGGGGVAVRGAERRSTGCP